MEIISSPRSGFCFGVKRAVKLAEAAGAKKGAVFSLGPLIHNPVVIQELSEKGVKIISNLGEIHRGETLVIRSHGVHPQLLSQAREKGVKVIDATCPFVSRCQKLAQLLARQGYLIIVFGDKNHSEVKSIVGFTDDQARVVASPRDLARAVKGVSKIGLLSQTTQSLTAFKELVGALLDLVPEVRIFNTICHAATSRQEEARKLSKKVDLAMVVGGKDSANTRQLVSIFRQARIKTYHLEDPRELKSFHLNGYKRIGVIAGASTPDWITREVIKYLKNLHRKGGIKS